MGHSLENLPQLFQVSRRAVTTAWQNIILFAGVFNLAAVGLAATGILSPIGAAVTHQLSSFFVMINSLRLLRVERAGRSPRFWFDWLSRTPIPAAWSRLRWAVSAFDLRDAFTLIVERRRDYWRPAALTAFALILLSGIHVIGAADVGIIERFGRRLVPAEPPGLHYKFPWPIDRLTRVQATRIRTVEIGYRSYAARADSEPAAYEWNVQHRSGRFQTRPEESRMLAGDQNMMEVNAVVHYRLSKPDEFLLRQLDGESTVRSAAEAAMAAVVTTTLLDDILTTGRKLVESRVKSALQTRLDRYGAGVEVVHVQLLDVHPSVEVVDAFREVSGAYEEKNRMINEAEGYRNEQIAVSRGNAKAMIANARGYSLGKKNRADGDAGRFVLREEGYRTNPGLTETRLYLETMEQVLPGKRKMIVDSSRGRRHLLLLEDGVEIAPPGAAVLAPGGPRVPIE
jgi:HflK protein